MPRPLVLAALVPFFALVASAAAISATDPDAIRRGEYIFNAGGCAGCHTDIKQKGPLLAGGRPMDTPFGRFYGPNITPDLEYGIGSWTDEQFITALQSGISPQGKPYYPSFPYTAFTKATRQDLLDLKSYIFSLPAVSQPNRPHELRFPFNFRLLLWPWRFLNFEPGTLADDPSQDATLNRGRYLVEALGRCSQCHTPRNALGATIADLNMAGAIVGPDGPSFPNISPHPDTGIGSWSIADIVQLLKSGLTPDFDSVGASMGEVVEETTSRLLDQDLEAIAQYLLSLPPIDNKIAKPTSE